VEAHRVMRRLYSLVVKFALTLKIAAEEVERKFVERDNCAENISSEQQQNLVHIIVLLVGT
jgi:hypothetical protein